MVAGEMLNTGEMPNTDFRFEEFEGLLASYALTLAPLKASTCDDAADYDTAIAILDGFADRYKLQKPKIAIDHPRRTREKWGQPKDFGPVFMLLDMMRSFYVDFSIGMEAGTTDCAERLKLGRLILKILVRYSAIEANCESIDGEEIPVSTKNTDRDLGWRTLAALISGKPPIEPPID